ncbi:MAG: hypothetical protein RL095_3907 [Verrucomicrobiota bacterium]|jgi:hypothetical protein
MSTAFQLPLADGGTCTVRRECLIISRIPSPEGTEESGSFTVSEGDASWTLKFADLKGRRILRRLGIALLSLLSTYAIAKLMKLEISGVKVEDLVAVSALLCGLYALLRFFWTKPAVSSDSSTPLIQRDELLHLEWGERELAIHYRLGQGVKIRRLQPLDLRLAREVLTRHGWERG